MTDRELLEENNKILKEIINFVRKVDSTEYRDHQDFMEFLRNVAADRLSEKSLICLYRTNQKSSN